MPSTTPTAPSFLTAYESGDLTDAFELRPGDLDTALSQPRPHDRARLAAVLRRRHEAWGMGAVAARSLEKLAHPASRAIVTGQQIGWLLGPTFTLSKAATAIALARRLDRADRPVVPLFWMATQDHDVDEMDHAWLLSRDERLTRLSVRVPAGPAVGRASLRSADVAAVRAALRSLDGAGPHADEVDMLLADACEGARGWSDAFARLLLRLFGEAGMLVVDPLDPELATLWRPALERELDAPEVSSRGIVDAGRRLAERGFAPLLGRGDDASNLFVEAPGGGPRTLLRHRAGSLSVGGERVERQTLSAYLDTDPTSLTPAAGLRPVIQDLTLPTAVFVVGPGELRYLAQLRPVYQHHGVAMPLVWPRASVTLLQPPVRRILDRHALEWQEVCADPERAMSELLLRQHGYAGAATVALSDLEAAFEALLRATHELDPTLDGAVARGRRHLDRTVVGLRDKVARALRRRDDDLQRQFQRLRSHLRPNGGHQERVLSPFSFFLTLGVDPVRDAFLGLEPEGHQALRF